MIPCNLNLFSSSIHYTRFKFEILHVGNAYPCRFSESPGAIECEILFSEPVIIVKSMNRIKGFFWWGSWKKKKKQNNSIYFWAPQYSGFPFIRQQPIARCRLVRIVCLERYRGGKTRKCRYHLTPPSSMHPSSHHNRGSPMEGTRHKFPDYWANFLSCPATFLTLFPSTSSTFSLQHFATSLPWAVTPAPSYLPSDT